MEGVIANFCRNRHTCSSNQLVIVLDSVTKRVEAAKLVGKKVVYNTGKKNLAGKVASAHGNKGALRVIFETGMPGQSLGQKVKIE
ncbi:MAG TPA: 50S ribosomal protein L35ae [Candidatus Nanoarchaeia archaeon]|nr:50S ribosomal protein L35ae [Candidatus Nanoarchaeia archaeon]